MITALTNLAVTIAIALTIAVLQMLMKGNSRTNRRGRNHGLNREDALFWTDWTIAGCFALVGSVAIAANRSLPIAPAQVWLSASSLTVCCLGFPFFLRTFAYGRDAKLKHWGWKGAGWIVIANSAGMLVLLGAVLAGAEVYATR